MQQKIIYQAHLHGIIFAWPLCFFMIGAVFYAYFPEFSGIAYILFGFAFIRLILAVLTYYSTVLIIKSDGLTLRTGVFVRYHINIAYSKIESLDLRQSLLGSMLHYGSVIVTGTGSTSYQIDRLNHPLTCRRYIEQYRQGHEAANQ